MRKFLRNRDGKIAIVVGSLVGLATGIAFALGIILSEGGGSLSRGWKPGSGYLSFYGIFLFPVMAFVALVTIGLVRLLGAGLVTLVSAIGLAAMVIHDFRTSNPGAQLARLTGQSEIPDLEFERFEIGHTFSDGTSYLWVALCSPDQATRFAESLHLGRIPTWQEMDEKFPVRIVHPAVNDYKGIFDGDIYTIEFYLGDKGMIGGYSPMEKKFRLYWWPSVNRE